MKKLLFILFVVVFLTACNPLESKEKQSSGPTLSTKIFDEASILQAVKTFPAKGNNNQTYPLVKQLDNIREETSANFKKLAREETDYQTKRIWQALSESYRQMSYEWHASELNPGLWEVLIIMHQPSPSGEDIQEIRTLIMDTMSKTIRGNSQSCQFLDETLTGKFRPSKEDKSEKCRFKMPNL